MSHQPGLLALHHSCHGNVHIPPGKSKIRLEHPTPGHPAHMPGDHLRGPGTTSADHRGEEGSEATCNLQRTGSSHRQWQKRHRWGPDSQSCPRSFSLYLSSPEHYLILAEMSAGVTENMADVQPRWPST